MPVWVPTIYADFEPVTPIGAGDLVINVKRNGFTNLGGPQPQREYILIHLHDGTRYYRKITNSVILSDKVERIFIDAALGADVSLVALNRISFLVLCRLDQDAVEMIHHTATRGMTTVVAVFRSAAAKDGIENIIEVPPGVVPSVACLDDFVWQTTLSARPGGLAWGMRPDRLDRFGNYYNPGGAFEDSYTSVYNTNGVLIKTLYSSTIETDINTYYGFSVVSHKPAFYSTFAGPIRQGRYVLAYLRSETVGYAYDHWWALYDPATWTVVGAINRYDLLGPPMANGVHIWEIYDDISPILFQGEYAYGAITNIIGVLPSINEFLDGTYNAGWGGFRPGYTPSAVLFPIGNYDLSYRFLVQMIRNSNRTWGFRLPGIGRQLLYIYVGRREVQYDITNTLFNPELRNVLGPVYPYGLMLKISLGDVSSFADIAVGDLGHPVFKGHATEMYTIDNANWRDQDDGALIPFLDEYTYLSDDTIGGDDSYSVQVSTQLRTNGKYWVVFAMAGLADAKYRGGGAIDYADPVYAKIRVFQYDPATEVAIQEFEHVCVLHTHADLPHTGTEGVRVITDSDTYIMAEIIEEGTIGTVILHMPVYKVSFCQFTLPEYL